jgi:hypothetical protein
VNPRLVSKSRVTWSETPPLSDLSRADVYVSYVDEDYTSNNAKRLTADIASGYPVAARTSRVPQK